jgi:hypothetical protein
MQMQSPPFSFFCLVFCCCCCCLSRVGLVGR